MIQPRMVTVDGVSRTLSQWARQPGAVSRSQISARLQRGVDPKAAVFGRNPNVRHITIAGRTMCAADWAKCVGARDRREICVRLDRGEDPIDAVFYDRRYAPKACVVVPFSVYALRPTWGGVRSITWKAA